MITFAPMYSDRNKFRKEQSKLSAKSEQNSIYGIRAVSEAILAGKELNKVIIQRGVSNPLMQGLVTLLNTHKIPFQYIPQQSGIFNTNKNHQGVIAHISPVTYFRLDDVIPQLYEEGKVPFILVLDRITDVRNFGAIARSAYCAGVNTLVIPDIGGALVTDDAIKTSAGALNHISVCREKNMKSTMELLNQSGITTIACTEKGAQPIFALDLKIPIAIVLGNEETGISADVIKKCSFLAKIPMEFGVQSLNVSVAAGIACYEVTRQRMLDLK